MSSTVSLAYDLDGSGPFLVAIHGITENRHFWDRVPLAAYFRVLRVDLRGHGESPRVAPFDPVTLAEDVHALVDRLGVEEEPPLVVGHSYGGVVATVYASRFPTRGVVDVDQSLDVSPLPEEVAATMRGDGFEAFFSGMFANIHGELDPAIVADLTARRTLRQDVVLGAWEPLLTLDADELTAWMRGLTTLPAGVPYLSLHGLPVADGYPDWLRERIPGAVVESAPVVTHYPHLADPEWFVKRLVAFASAASTE